MSYDVLDMIRFPFKYFKATVRAGDGKSNGGARCVPEGNARQDSSSRSVFLLAGAPRGKFPIFHSVLCRTWKVICVRTVIKVNRLPTEIYFFFLPWRVRKT